MTTPLPGNPTHPPTFTAQRLLYIATGGIQAMFMPSWLTWLRTTYPTTNIRYAITNSARRFVGTTAIASAGGNGLPLIDTWPEQPDHAQHIELANWPDAILVHPATMHFLARLSLGLADTPILLALQCTTAPTVICPSLPPNAHTNPAYQRHITELTNRHNTTILPPITGTSLTTGQQGIGTPTPLPHAITALQDLLT